jgi:hypothetical protein
MKKSIRECHIALKLIMGCLLLVLPACDPTLTPTFTPTSSSIPSLTPSPTATATLTSTATFTFTPSPTPTPLVAGIGQVIFSESFDDMDFPFGICGAAHIESGVLVVERGPENPSPCGMFSGGIYGYNPIPVDATLLVRFKTNIDFNIGIHYGDSNNYHRFTYGITRGIATWDLMKVDVSGLTTWRTNGTRADEWYYFSLHRLANGKVHAKLWQEDDPSNITEFQVTFDSEWATLPLTFVADFVHVPFYLDEYQIVK